MFKLIRTYLFQMRVQAELKGQYEDQAFVNRICHAPDAVKEIYEISVNAYFKKDKVAPFLTACQILNLGMKNDAFDHKTRSACAALLAQRLQRVESNPQFRLRHLLIIGEFEERVRNWAAENVDSTLLS